jgi:hypothetical protein
MKRKKYPEEQIAFALRQSASVHHLLLESRVRRPVRRRHSP